MIPETHEDVVGYIGNTPIAKAKWFTGEIYVKHVFGTTRLTRGKPSRFVALQDGRVCPVRWLWLWKLLTFLRFPGTRITVVSIHKSGMTFDNFGIPAEDIEAAKEAYAEEWNEQHLD